MLHSDVLLLNNGSRNCLKESNRCSSDSFAFNSNCCDSLAEPPSSSLPTLASKIKAICHRTSRCKRPTSSRTSLLPFPNSASSAVTHRLSFEAARNRRNSTRKSDEKILSSGIALGSSKKDPEALLNPAKAFFR
uniref:E3 ubiquitin-protein ligase UPL2-like n=1 Tax=Rhizophora mucronata TaxID=61149 RepID=A0A2P2MUY1_RHIMU